MLKLLRRLVSEEEGQGLVEYALIIGLVAVVLIVALQSMEGGIAGVFDRIRDRLIALPTPPP
jgi:pilus assembly protein Flp/PilA